MVLHFTTLHEILSALQTHQKKQCCSCLFLVSLASCGIFFLVFFSATLLFINIIYEVLNLDFMLN